MRRFQKSLEYIPGEQAGESLERELLGVVRNVGTIEEERERVHKRMDREKISEFDAAIEDIKERQDGSPVNPKQTFANEVRIKVFDILEDINDDTKLTFYTTTSGTKNKTVLDKDFGIDFFIELEHDKEKLVKVTVDITLKSYKQNPKADIVFSLPDYQILNMMFFRNIQMI